MIRRPPRSTPKPSSAASDVYKRQAYSHTSIAIRDAISSIKVPVLEVHISNIYAREAFRNHSHISAVAVGVISGLGLKGYNLALDYFSYK